MIANGLLTIAKTIVTNSSDKQPLLRRQVMAEKIPHARLAVIPGTAHLNNLEQPDTFNQTVAAFVSELSKEKQS